MMEHASGVQLHDVWRMMDTHQHMLVTKALSKLVIEMAKIIFPAYGSLYFDNAAIGLQRKIDFTDGFIVGPHCGRDYWDGIARDTRYFHERSPNQGPCEFQVLILRPILMGRARDQS
jgi:hypothetical protein